MVPPVRRDRNESSRPAGLAKHDRLLLDAVDELEAACVHREYAGLHGNDVLIAYGNGPVYSQSWLLPPGAVAQRQFIEHARRWGDDAAVKACLDRLQPERIAAAAEIGIPTEQASWRVLLDHKLNDLAIDVDYADPSNAKPPGRKKYVDEGDDWPRLLDEMVAYQDADSPDSRRPTALEAAQHVLVHHREPLPNTIRDRLEKVTARTARAWLLAWRKR